MSVLSRLFDCPQLRQFVVGLVALPLSAVPLPTTKSPASTTTTRPTTTCRKVNGEPCSK